MARIVDPAGMARPLRTAFALLLALLLVGMQHEALRHALAHFKPAQALHASTAVADAPCGECALLAGGSAALSGARAIPPAKARVDGTPRLVAVAPTPSPPSPYRSRAPPALS
jgi:hypothetical protein